MSARPPELDSRTSVGAKRASSPNTSVNTSPRLSHCALPKSSMPSHVSAEYASIAVARYAGLSLCSHTSSIHTKARNKTTAGQAPSASG